MTPVLGLLRISFTIYRKNAALFGGYAAWLLLPLIAAGIFGFLDLGIMTFPIGIFLLAINGIIWLWLFTLMTRTANLLIQQQQIDQQNISQTAWQMLILVAATIGLVILTVLGGVLLLIIPAFLFLVWFALAPTITALEGGTAIASLAKSKKLTKNRFFSAAWRVIGGPFLILLGYAFVLSIVLLMLFPVTGLQPGQVETINPPVWIQFFDAVIQIFIMPWVIIYLTLVYKELNEKQKN